MHDVLRQDNGGPEGIRTPDLLTASQTRSQLRHGPTACAGPVDDTAGLKPSRRPDTGAATIYRRIVLTREIEHDEIKGGGYMASPEARGPHPAVVIVHEAEGINENIRDVARRFAEAGYVGLAVDMFAGRNRAICMTRYMAGMLSGSLNRYGIADLKDALTFLARKPEVDARRMGAIGFCMGGGFAIA